MYENEHLFSIASRFVDPSTITEIKPLGNGLINDTFKIMAAGQEQPRYVLQHINDKVFTDVEMLQRNIEIVTGHIRQKYEAARMPDIDRRVLRFMPAKGNGKLYTIMDDGTYWRMMVFIDNHGSISPREGRWDSGMRQMPS